MDLSRLLRVDPRTVDALSEGRARPETAARVFDKLARLAGL